VGNVICTVNGWLKKQLNEQERQFFYNGIQPLEKRTGPSAFQLQEIVLKSNKI